MPKKKKVKKNDDTIENLSSEEDTEIGFVDNPIIIGKKVASFCFKDTVEHEEATDINKEKSHISISQKEPTFKRCYMLKKSTIRKVDELKAQHPSITTYVSEIVEAAINYYYYYVFNSENSNK